MRPSRPRRGRNIDAENSPGFHETARDREILLARRRVPGRMIMGQDQARGRDRDGGLVHLARMDDARVQAADGDDLAAEHLIS